MSADIAPTQEATTSPEHALAAPSRGRRVLRRLLRDRIGLAGILLVLAIIAMALLAPLIAPYDPIATDLGQSFLPVGTAGHVLGTDLFGRDVLSRVIWGARPSLAVGFVATCIALSIGVTLGIVVGFYGGWFDTITMRVIDVMLAFPYLLLAIVIVAALGPGLFHAVLAVAITAIPFYVRLIRGMVLTFKEEQFVEASRAIGATNARLMRTAVLPNVMPYIIVAFSINIGYLILEAASLSFLGLGAQPPSPEWGAMLAENRNYLTIAPHTVVVPGVAIFLVIIGLNLFGDTLRDAFDVRLREE
ncbi:MAG TPA: ABC transporter permease [Thermomicrobiaceae bacterium]|nr:ABC transporter permease [Thermomicrobiaceae bacterium]